MTDARPAPRAGSTAPTPPQAPAAGFDATLGLGSNIGDKSGNLARAVAMLEEGGGLAVVARSSLWRSEPWGVTDQDTFVNAAVGIVTALPPRALLARCQQVEARMGRVRERRWGPRIVDVDILTFRDWQVSEPDLVIPHPLIAERGFVLAPLAEIAPELLIGGRRVDDLLAAADGSGLARIGDFGG